MQISFPSVTYESDNSPFYVVLLQKNGIMCIDPKCFCLKRALNAVTGNTRIAASFGGG